ncbi:molybdopterin-dependent oxidoreductase [Ferrimonas pelagia]|uniref:Nitrate reductase n=1 Tax=Ferrimonas pelagia TaxID=1177826 RepID=A0ABP9FBA9_9GAMM
MSQGTTRTTCPYCGVGCGVLAKHQDGITTVSGDPDHRASFGKLCTKGMNLGATTDPEGRLLYPQIRGQRESWSRALAYVGSQLRDTLDRHGPDSVAFYVSGQLLTEDYYVANKLMKGFIGSGNIDTNSRLCMSSAVAAHKRALGADAVSGCYADLELADLIVLTGSNLAWCHPVLYQRILAAKAKRPEMKLVVIDPRRTASCHGADLHIPLKAGTDLTLFNGLLHSLRKQGQLMPDRLASLDEVLPTLELAARGGEVAQVAAAIDVDVASVSQLFDWFAATDKVVTVFSQGINQSDRGVDQGNAILNCHLASGRFGRPGATAFSITGQPNAMGGREVGGLANSLAAHMEFGDVEAHQRISQFWQVDTLATEPGLKAVDLFDGIESGQIKAVWIMGTNPAVSLPDSARVRRALADCPLVIVSDCVAQTDTTALADVLLPAQGWGEKDGTVTNSERRISRQRAFLPPAGEAKPDWWILCQVAKAMGFGHGFEFANAAAIFREHAELSGLDNAGDQRRDFDISALAQLNDRQYDTLSPLQWPQPAGGPLQLQDQRLCADGRFFTTEQRARLVPVAAPVSAVPATTETGMRLNSGRWRDQWHTMTRTAKAGKLNQHAPEPLVQCHPRDAGQQQLRDGQLVRLSNGQGEAVLKLQITDAVRPGELFMPLHWNGQFASQAWINDLVAPLCDPISGQPAFKQSQVQIEAVSVSSVATLLSSRPLVLDGMRYWSRIPVDGGLLYHIGSELSPTALAQTLALRLPRQGQWRRLQGRSGARTCVAMSDGDQLQWLWEISADSDSLLGSGFSELLSQPFEASQLRHILVPKSRAAGAMLCACRQVSERQVGEAINAGANSVAALGECTGAGLGCGSCQGDLAERLRDAIPIPISIRQVS